MKIEKNFTIKLCSDCNFEEMVADVYWKDHPFAMLNYDQGAEKVEIEIYAPPDGQSSWLFSYKDCINALEAAKNYLLETE